MTRVRALSETGIGDFRGYLGRLAEGDATAAVPSHLLTRPDSSRELPLEALIDPDAEFFDRMALGRYLVDRLKPLDADPTTDASVGLWTWLALVYFDVICPPRSGGLRRPGATHRYILSTEFGVHYRHLVRTPCMLYRMHGEQAAALLSGKPDTHGEAAEQILGRERLLTNQALFGALDHLYVIRNGGNGATVSQLKRGARSKEGGGTMRRLGKIIGQFDLTFDLHGMTAEQIVELLPAEFNRFK